jgi:hypothetical protein
MRTFLQCLVVWGTVRVEFIQSTHDHNSEHSKTEQFEAESLATKQILL